MSSYTASPGRYTNAGRRAVLVSLFGPSYLTVICSLFLVRQWIQFMSVSFGFCENRDMCAQCLLCLFREIPQMQFLDKVCSHFVVQRQVPAFVRTSLLWRRGSSPWSICSCSWCSSRTRFFGVVHSPFELLDHRCHCNCRDLVLFVGRLSWLCGPFLLRECLRRDVVWWWFYSWWCLRFCLGQCEADGWKIPHQLFPVPRSLGVYACCFTGSAATTKFAQTTTTIPGSS